MHPTIPVSKTPDSGVFYVLVERTALTYCKILYSKGRGGLFIPGNPVYTYRRYVQNVRLALIFIYASDAAPAWKQQVDADVRVRNPTPCFEQ